MSITFTKSISRCTLKLLIPDDFRDNYVLICRKDRVATTSLTRDVAVGSFCTVKQAWQLLTAMTSCRLNTEPEYRYI